ncbi:long-chain fatty acid--CoA ligase [Acinetobacter sp. ANC 3882]|uniref:long-chain fatty acid--CoA ligase n=1 Tax=Acinetobacter sp. ANC 3882 TaxID=2923423 RepID=UPI001F4AD0CE|nr:long-chain fatty acid--CoA ligase [Acinetobacter sp. ANC 3882]MCH7314801.1 long-chain fatty acid--CoA ligase [Acinetobacter sp. ANC 3882]
MFGKMIHQDLLISNLIEHAAKYHADTAIFSREVDGQLYKTDWKRIQQNTKRLANAFKVFNLTEGDRIATIAWNNHRHLESWYAISGCGYVCHTINPRLFLEQLTFIINDAQDKVIFFDITFLPLISALKDKVPSVEKFICLSAYDESVAAALPNVIFYDALIQDQSVEFDWPQFKEETPSSLCYTSGTTGNPKGVLYSHRSTLLHSMAIALPDSLNISARDIVMPVVPMFHVNAWGIPYAAAMVGSSLVLPGPNLDGESLVHLIDDYKVSVALGVPTIWQGLLVAAKKIGSSLESMQRNVVGGATCPPSIIREFKNTYHCDTIHAWGMSEISPLGTANQPKAKHDALNPDELEKLRQNQGRPPFGIELRIVDENSITPLANDGHTQGNLQVRGPWVVDHYFNQAKSSLTSDGWFDTGDIATIDSDGYMTIRDRAKDLIKSGGEWISSVELENIAVGHPEIRMAAAIAARHPKWDERPILIAVKQEHASLTEQDVLAYFADKIASWQVPDAVIFVEALPINGTGKIVKAELREKYGDFLLKS